MKKIILSLCMVIMLVTMLSIEAFSFGQSGLEKLFDITIEGMDRKNSIPPIPLDGTTNAVEAMAVDYLANDQVKAVYFGTKTMTEPYQHDYIVCGRFHGCKISPDTTYEIPLGTDAKLYFEGAVSNNFGYIEKACVLNLYVNEKDCIVYVHSKRIQDLYPKNTGFQFDCIYNIQIWSVSEDLTRSLLLNLLNKISDLGYSTRFLNTKKPEPVTFYVESQTINGYTGTINLRSTMDKVETVEISVSRKLTKKNKDVSPDVRFTREIYPGLNRIEVGFRDAIDALVFIRSNHQIDKVYLGRGFWYKFYHKDATCSIKTLEPPGGLKESEDNLVCFQGIALDANLKTQMDIAGAGYMLNPNGKEVLLKSFDSLKISLQGKGTLQLVVKNIDENKEASVYSYEMTLPQERETISIPLKFFRHQKTGRAFDEKHIKAVEVIFDGAQNKGKVNLKIDSMTFMETHQETVLRISELKSIPDSDMKRKLSFVFSLNDFLIIFAIIVCFMFIIRKFKHNGTKTQELGK